MPTAAAAKAGRVRQDRPRPSTSAMAASMAADVAAWREGKDGREKPTRDQACGLRVAMAASAIRETHAGSGMTVESRSRW